MAEPGVSIPAVTGLNIAFASSRAGDYNLYVVNADGSDERVLLAVPGYQMYPAWSEDGQWIAYESGANSIDGLQIRMVHPDGTGDREVTEDTATNRFPAWSVGGRLAWSASGQIMLLDEMGATPHAIAEGQFPAWRSWTRYRATRDDQPPGRPRCTPRSAALFALSKWSRGPLRSIRQR